MNVGFERRRRVEVENGSHSLQVKSPVPAELRVTRSLQRERLQTAPSTSGRQASPLPPPTSARSSGRTCFFDGALDFRDAFCLAPGAVTEEGSEGASFELTGASASLCFPAEFSPRELEATAPSGESLLLHHSSSRSQSPSVVIKMSTSPWLKACSAAEQHEVVGVP